MQNYFFRKKNILFILSVVSVLIISCAKRVETHYPNGSTESRIEYRFGKMHGQAVWYYEHGKKRMEAQYVHGSLQGVCNRYYRNGSLESRSHYQQDTLEGEMLVYDEDGAWLSERFVYHKGKKNGPYACYHDGDQVMVEGAFKDDQFHGEWRYYDANGFLVGKAFFRNGDGNLEAYGDQGQVIRKVEYRNSQKNGTEQFLDGEGNVKRTSYYKDGRLLRTDTLEKVR